MPTARCLQGAPRGAFPRIALALLSVAFCSCRKGEAARASALSEPVGIPLAKGTASDLRLTADEKYATFLMDPQKPRLTGVPPPMVVGALYAASLEKKESRKLGDGVTNVPGGYLFSPDSRWVLYLAGYNASNQSGQLYAAELAGGNPPVELGRAVTYFLVSPDSRWVAFVDGGALKAGRLASGPFRSVGGEVSTAQFSPDSRHLLYRRKLSAGASLLLTELEDGRVWKLGDQVGDYAIAADSRVVSFAKQGTAGPGTYDLFSSSLSAVEAGGPAKTLDALPARKVASRSGFFAFSPDGHWLGWVENRNQENAGDLYVAPAQAAAGRKIGGKVVEFSFAPDSNAITYLDSYTDAARAGILAVTALPDGKPRHVGNRVPNFSWSANGKRLAFLSRFIKPIYSVDLMLYSTGEENGSKVHQGVFGYGFSPQNRYLFFRTNCIRDGRACDLYQLELSEPKAQPKKILEGVYTFRASENEERLLVTYARVDIESFDLAVYNLKTTERKPLSQQVQSSAVFAVPDGSKVAYVVAERRRAGVYLADLTAFPPGRGEGTR